jgi:hypothetical protein
MRLKKSKKNLRFCGLEEKFSSWENSKIVVLPVAYDLTTSYKSGTIDGPKAIIDASRYMEVYDEETGKEVSGLGIHTAKEIRSLKLQPEGINKRYPGRWKIPCNYRRGAFCNAGPRTFLQKEIRKFFSPADGRPQRYERRLSGAEKQPRLHREEDN